VFLAGEERGDGEGRSKKQAEQGAARSAWLALQQALDERERTTTPAIASSAVADPGPSE
jgi:hypothetical protein